MLVFGILFLLFVLVLLRRLLFDLARLVVGLMAHTLPFFIGFTAGTMGYRHGAGVVGAVLLGVLVAGAAVALGQMAFNLARSAALRGVIALVYAVPAAMAGYYVALNLARVVIASPGLCQVLATLSAIVAGGVCVLGMIRLAPPLAETEAEAHRPTAGLAASTQG